MNLSWRRVCLECWVSSSGLKKCRSRLLVIFPHSFINTSSWYTHKYTFTWTFIHSMCQTKSQEAAFSEPEIIVCVCVCVYVLVHVGNSPKVSPKQGLTIRCTWRWLSRVMSPSAGCSSAWNIINSYTPKPALQPASKRYAWFYSLEVRHITRSTGDP